MKKSNYNIFIQTKGLTVCYNSFTDRMLAANNRVYETFRDKDISYFRETYPAQYLVFEDSGFIIPDEKDELSEIRFLYKMDSFSEDGNYTMMVFPTQDCNLNCWYCYESHVRNSFMNEDVQERVLKYIHKKVQNSDIKSFQLSFFGGEPLLHFNKIAFPLAHSAREICEKNSVRFTTSFITNGTLINEKNLHNLLLINPSFQITLDGNREKHDMVRVGKYNDAPTYDKIIHALYLLSDRLPYPEAQRAVPVVLRINYDNDTLMEIDTLIEDIKELDKKKIVIHMERVWQTINMVDDEQKRLLFSTISKLIGLGFAVKTGTFNRRNYSCPAEKFHAAIVNYDGNLYRCNGRTLTPDNAEGYITENGDLHWYKEQCIRRLGRTTFENPMCIQCKMLPSCMGPCSQKCMEKNWGNLEEVCSMKALGMSLEESLLLWAQRELIQQKVRNAKIEVNPQEG